jgi:excisionase family DNA binding protein
MSDITHILLQEIKQLRLDVQAARYELQIVRTQVDGLKPEGKRYVSVKYVAQELNLSDRTIRRLCELGKIQANQPSKDRGRWRIPNKELERLKKEAQANKFNS